MSYASLDGNYIVTDITSVEDLEKVAAACPRGYRHKDYVYDLSRLIENGDRRWHNCVRVDRGKLQDSSSFDYQREYHFFHKIIHVEEIGEKEPPKLEPGKRVLLWV